MSNYNNDQFFNLRNVGEEALDTTNISLEGSFIIPATNNDPFVYPSNTIRTLDTRSLNGRLFTEPLKKGYIRSLAYDDAYRPVKCGFQFNPSSLNQSVNQNTQILNFLQQSVSQYSQPINGAVNFNFSLLFDRSMELNNYNTAGRPSAQGFDNGSLWANSDPSVVGVLHDIGTLYAAIGVGISQSQQEYIQSVLADQIAGEINTSIYTGEETEGETAVNDRFNEKTSQLSSLMDINLGNTAFLLPIPVRVVFSTLYMVEGLVQNVSVRYVKFNTAMVPMQCSVDVTMEAKYVGFAKRNTFFTAALKERRQIGIDAEAAREAAAAAVEAEIGLLEGIGPGSITDIEVAIYGDDAFGFDDDRLERLVGISGYSADDKDGKDRKARIRLYPNRQGLEALRSAWQVGSEVSISFECTTNLYRVVNQFYDDPSIAPDWDQLDRVPINDTQINDGDEELISKWKNLLGKIDDWYQGSDAELKAAISDTALRNDILNNRKGNRDHIYTFKDSISGQSSVNQLFHSAQLIRTDVLNAEPGFTSFSNYEELREKLDRSNDFITSAELAFPVGGNPDRSIGAFSTDEGQAIDFAVWIITYDITITLSGGAGATTTGRAFGVKSNYFLGTVGDKTTKAIFKVKWDEEP